MHLRFINREKAYLIDNIDEGIFLYLLDYKKTLLIKKEFFKYEEEMLILSEVDIPDDIIAVINYNHLDYYLHIKNKKIYISPFLNGFSEKSIDLKIQILFKNFKLIKTKYSYKIIDQANNFYEIDYKIFEKGSKPLKSLQRTNDDEPYEYVKIEHNDNCVIFIEYNKKSNAMLLRTLHFELMYSNNIDVKFKPLSNNKFILEGLSEIVVKRSELHDKKQLVIETINDIPKFDPILLKVNNLYYVIEFYNKKKIKLYYDKKTDLFLNKSKLKSWVTPKGIYFKGVLNLKFNKIKIDTIVDKNRNRLAKIQWLNSNQIKFFIPNKKLIELSEVHNTLYAAYGTKIIFPLHFKSFEDISNRFLCYKNLKEHSFISRINLNNNYTITMIPKSPIYSLMHRIKINLAYAISLYLKKFINKNVNLYFEKDASTAHESGYVTFEKVKNLKHIRSINKYILDSKSKKFRELKRKYGKDLIKRYTFKHYLYIFLATNFISSELSNHVLSVRVFHNLLLRKIRETPLYFLQHGIMFAKPVDNPMFKSFHKENQTNNIIKSVISSDLEAKEFYKMGYTDDDLMKTGLPKLDKARLEKNADKIAFMPTWRYWEEGMILKGDIVNTTYYKTLMEIIHTFKKAGLLDRLLLVPHNKFAEYIKEKFNEYKNLICTNPSEALEKSIIFITDYSSIIYDAIYRGAYPIFYWKEKDYLIENYKAEPPVNEENAPGKIAKSNEELIAIIKEAIETDYKIPEYIKEKYLKINEFNDNRNTERVIKELQKLNVL